MTQGLKKIACSVAAATVLAALGGCTGGGGGQPTDQPTDPADTQSSTDGTTPAADPCADGRRTLVAAVQRYVDGYGTPADSSGTPSASPGPSTGDTDLKNAIAQSRAEIERKSCDEQAYERALSGDLDGVRTRGPLAAAVLLRLGASLTGAARTVKETRDVGPGDDLPRVLAEVAPGSTLRLAPGTFRLARSLVLLQGVTLLGSGPGRTTVSSGAAGAVLLVLTEDRVELSGISVRHTGRRAASGVVGGPTSSLVLTGSRVSGAVESHRAEGGGAGVLMSARSGDRTARGTTLEVTRSEFSGNSGAGVLLSGRHRASIRGARFVDNGQCGVCFTGRSDGAVRSSRFSGNTAGVAALDRSRPQLVDDRFSGGLVGVQASGAARPVVLDSVVDGARRAAMIFGDTASGRVARTTCRNVRFGIVVGPRTFPSVGSNAGCTVSGSR